MEKKIAELQKLAAEATKQIEVMSARSQTDAASDIPEDACQWSDGDFQSARMTLIDNARTLLQSTLGPTEYIKDEVPIVSRASTTGKSTKLTHIPRPSSSTAPSR